MVCPLCAQRKAKRACPALGQQICAVCCGTKRRVEINCPDDCIYLKTSQAHPPAVVQRQRGRDVAALAPTLAGLTEPQTELYFLVASFLARHQPADFQRLLDDDVAEAAAALAATSETAAKGVIYEHQAAGLPAARLAQALKEFLEPIGKRAGTRFDRDAAVVLRRVERGAREARASAPGGPTAYLELIARLLRPAPAQPDEERGGNLVTA